MESKIVIKVKYGETLRRFNARVDEDGKLDLDMVGLREKILGLFGFSPETDLTLTYIDEDGDVVTLVDEEDLHDVMNQALNPLRLTVKLNTEKGGRVNARSSGVSTPLRSPWVRHPSPNSAGFSEILKSVPETLRETLSKLSLDMISKAASTAPGIAELVDSLSKLEQSYLDLQFQAGAHACAIVSAGAGAGAGAGASAGAGSNIQSGVSGSTLGAPGPMNVEASKNDGSMSHPMPKSKVEQPTTKTDTQNGTSSMRGSFTVDSSSVDRYDVDVLHGIAVPSESTFVNHASTASCNAMGNLEQKIEKLDALKNSTGGWKSLVGGASTSAVNLVGHATVGSKVANADGIMTTKFPSGPGNNAVTQLALNPTNECPFTGTTLTDSSVPFVQYGPHVFPFKRSYNRSDGMGTIFHMGICCDGCGVLPITGPRFKSKIKEDYDLCSICFSEMGNNDDYIRMDSPVNRCPYPFKGLNDLHSEWQCQAPPHVLKGGIKPIGLKLDSCFIVDINVLDNATMAPSTPFTKVWRMKNNGTIAWPQGTQLVCIGGDKLSIVTCVQVEISTDGFSVDKEIDIAVDFCAPELPGQYISYWRMASPSGQKFGQCVWVLIQVDASLKDSLCDSSSGLNLNLPPNSGETTRININVNVEPMMEDGAHVPDDYIKDTEVEEPIAETQPNIEEESSFPSLVGEDTKLVEPITDTYSNEVQEPSFPIHHSLLVGGSNRSPVPPEPSFPIHHSLLLGGGNCNSVPTDAAISVSHPMIDLSETAPFVSTSAASAPTAAPTTQGAFKELDLEQTLLRELEEMGFKEIDLNKEILRKNEYDLEQSVDDLCGVAEWDPILEELREMGFYDRETNKRLLKKNNGSIKHVVLDLIAGERA